jgi:Amt family ammonium transporter
MNYMKELVLSASLIATLGYFAFSASYAQEAGAPAESTKMEAPGAAPGAPAAEAKKEDPGAAPAQFTQGLMTQIGDAKVAMDTMWTLIAGMLVFFMNLGFASVESGLCRAKNTVTIMAKNFIVFAASSIAFLVLGWGLMFGDGNPLFGTQGLWFVSGADNSPAMGDAYKGVYSSINWSGVPLWTKFFFQLVFAGTAATIVSGAVAERVKFGAFYILVF